MELNFSEIRELLSLLNQSDVAEFILKSDDFELTLRKTVVITADSGALARPLSVQGVAPVPPPIMSPPPAIAPAPPPMAAATDRLVEIISPMVGTFYRSPAPGESPFVEVGDRIKPGQTVCIIEAMKLMNELEAEVSGEIAEILVQNGEPVEYGQPLMRVNPS